MPVKKHQIVWEPNIYGANHQTLVQVLKHGATGTRMTMLVGHNPGLVELLHFLCGSTVPTPADGKLLTTGAVARLEISVEWSQLHSGSARLLSITRPRDM